jgi:hypothetical protein
MLSVVLKIHKWSLSILIVFSHAQYDNQSRYILCVHEIQGWLRCVEQLGCHSIGGLAVSMAPVNHIGAVKTKPTHR